MEPQEQEMFEAFMQCMGAKSESERVKWMSFVMAGSVWRASGAADREAKRDAIAAQREAVLAFMEQVKEHYEQISAV